MDQIDYRIVRELQSDARQSNQELSERIGLSPSPCLRRVRLLEESGVIQGYSAIIDRERYGLPITAFVSVRLENQAKDAIAVFEQGIENLDEVISCHLMSGNYDYLLQVLSVSLKAYEHFIRHKLTRIPGIGSLETHFAFGEVKRKRRFPAVPVKF